MFAIVCRKKYGGLTVEAVTSIFSVSDFSFLTTSLAKNQRGDLFTLLILNFEEIFATFNPFANAPKEGKPKCVYVDSGKSINLRIGAETLDELKNIVITKGALENAHNYQFYKVEDHDVIQIVEESQIDHPALFFIPKLDYQQVEFPDIVEEIEDITPVAVEIVVKPNINLDGGDGESVPYLIWIFQNEKSYRAKDWNTSLSEEAELYIDVVNGEVFCNLISENNPDQVIVVKGANIYQVFDSSRYFIFKEKKTDQFVGVGFLQQRRKQRFQNRSCF